ncbi:hypothetical protein [Peribacillus simplex]|uniref:hypothetical protein n=1 Tax=Peribacillus simplex TaxID=1478 RepID=UPI001C869EFD|nr:hypothetical protein [Peribacillus simplex]
MNLIKACEMEFLVVNAQHRKAVPDRNQRELRKLVPYRRSIIEELARQNIKLGSVEGKKRNDHHH